MPVPAETTRPPQASTERLRYVGTLTSGAMQFATSHAPDGTDSGRPLELATVAAHLQTGDRRPAG
jgi:hypothetical protein